MFTVSLTRAAPPYLKRLAFDLSVTLHSLIKLPSDEFHRRIVPRTLATRAGQEVFFASLRALRALAVIPPPQPRSTRCTQIRSLQINPPHNRPNHRSFIRLIFPLYRPRRKQLFSG